MTKSPPRAPNGDPNAPQTPPKGDPGRDDVAAQVAKQLAPVEDFRARSEAWMKEITGQVARLASAAEGDDRKKGGLDKRLADLEARIQSLLTLTELISLDKNPFAETAARTPTASGAPAPQASAPAPPAPAAPPSAPRAAPAMAAAPPSPSDASADGHNGAPEPATTNGGQDPIRLAMSPEHRARVRAGEPPAAPVAPPAAVPRPSAPQPAPPPAPTPRSAAAHHPNDANAEPSVSPATRYSAPPLRPNDLDETRRRLLILEWAGLLSHELPRLDLGSFLGFYVETGWVDRDVAACVRNLSWQLHQAAPDAERPQRHPLPELHARSILMLAHLSDAPVPVDDARRIIREARHTTSAESVLIAP